MITLHWYDKTVTGDIAVLGDGYVTLYDNEYNVLIDVRNISGAEWNHISIEGGEWSSPDVIPTTEDYLRADVDFLTMENETLTTESEQARADIDYLLMITEEE